MKFLSPLKLNLNWEGKRHTCLVHLGVSSMSRLPTGWIRGNTLHKNNSNNDNKGRLMYFYFMGL